MDDAHDTTLRTGDVILCSNNTATGFLLRSATSSAWNHAGIAVRLGGDGCLTADDSGELYVLELNADKRFDILSGEIMAGMSLTQWEWAQHRYNSVVKRPLRAEHRTSSFLRRAERFIKRHHGASFSASFTPFLGVWLGLPLAGSQRYQDGRREFFCTEMMAEFYQYSLQGSLSQLFGEGAPTQACLYQPAHFSLELNRQAPIFHPHEVEVHLCHADAAIVLFQPLLIGLLLMVVMAAILPK